MTSPGPDVMLWHLRDAAERFALALDSGDLGSTVPACPGWTLAELAGHLGGVHRWAHHAIRHGEPGPETAAGPPGREALLAWFREGVSQLLDSLESTPGQTPTWHFGPKPRTVDFWLRRQAHETTIHAVDAVGALALPTWDLDPTFAADGVSEVAEMFYPRQVRLGRIEPVAAVLHFSAEDCPAWSAELVGTGPVVQVRAARAADLYFAVWKRAPLPGLDPRAAAALKAWITP